LLILPIAAVHDNPFSNQVLPHLPVIKQMWPHRFWMAYLPFLAIVSGLCLDSIFPDPKLRHIVAAGVIFLSAVQMLVNDRRYYDDQPYYPERVVDEWKRVRETGEPPPIHRLARPTTIGGQGSSLGFVPRDDGLTEGYSTIPCFEPIFGYDLENFPKENLTIGPTLHSDNGQLNIRNPVCYIFTEENDCQPGDNFSSRQLADAEAFINYRPYRFREPWWQHALGWLGLVTLITCLGVAIWAGWRQLSGWLQRQRSDR
jgi:hypothetical protein